MNAQAPPPRPVEVHAWVDVACPWCWIAKRRFEEAETEYGGEVTLEYHSFELAPDLPADYLSSEADFLQFLYAGTTREEAEQMMWVVRGTGARLGLSYDFDGVQHTSTFLAHQLLHHAKANGRQLPMLDVLFSAFFERGRDLRGIDELVALAAEVGLDGAGARDGAGDRPICRRGPGRPQVGRRATTSRRSRRTSWPGNPRSTARSDRPSSSMRCAGQLRNRRRAADDLG